MELESLLPSKQKIGKELFHSLNGDLREYEFRDRFADLFRWCVDFIDWCIVSYDWRVR